MQTANLRQLNTTRQHAADFVVYVLTGHTLHYTYNYTIYVLQQWHKNRKAQTQSSGNQNSNQDKWMTRTRVGKERRSRKGMKRNSKEVCGGDKERENRERGGGTSNIQQRKETCQVHSLFIREKCVLDDYQLRYLKVLKNKNLSVL